MQMHSQAKEAEIGLILRGHGRLVSRQHALSNGEECSNRA